jgi:Na+-driven multidrug efflux pump
MRNSYIINKAFNYYITASILTAVVSQLTVMTDAIIVGQFISPEALSAVNAATPLTMAVNAMYLLFVMGANVRLARLIGKQDTSSIKNLFTSIVWSVIPVGLLITCALQAFAEPISVFLCKEPSIHHYTADYLKAYSIGAAPMLLYLAFNVFVETAGKPRITAGVIIASNVFNVVFDLLLVGALGFGIAGSAWATVMSYVCGLLLITTLGVRKIQLFRLQVLKLKMFLGYVLQNVKEGFPVALGNISIGLLVFLLNTIITNALGVMGMNIWSICLQVLMLSLVVINGTTGCIYAVGGVICGEEDWKGLRLFELRVVKVLILSIALFVIVIEIEPLWLASIFGADENMRAAGLSRALRLFFLCEIPFAYIFVRQAMLQLLEYRSLAAVISIVQLLLLLGGVWGASLINPQYVWGSFSISMVVVLVAVYVVMFYLHRKKPETSIISLIPLKEEPLMLVRSMECTAEGIAAVKDEFESFVKSHAKDAEEAMKRINALTANLLTRTERGKDEFCDIMISFKAKVPFVKMKDIQGAFEKDSFAYEASYEVMNGQNVITINI